MKKLRKNIDLDNQTILVLQMEATANGYGTLKPFLEYVLQERASKAMKDHAAFYSRLNGTNKSTKVGKPSSKARNSR